MRYTPAIILVCTVLWGGCADTQPQQTEQDVKSMSGPTARPGGETEVWEVRNRWQETDSADARKAGMAWEADSGLSWDQKYAAWIEGLEIIERADYGKTFAILTPYGEKQLPAPWLDCAEVMWTLRIAFSSWYHLPFYVKGWYEGKAMFAGHMGFVTADGKGFPGFENYRDAYPDYEDSWSEGDAWPSNTSLRKKRLGTDDRNEFLEVEGGPELGAGAYFDEIFLNKRAGFFARMMLLFYGSVDLASSANMFHVEADAIRASDVLLKRNTPNGSGHTVPILKVARPLPGKIAVEVAWGNVPRSQPKWEDTLAARYRFTSNVYGGKGENSDGIPYAKLGGGVRRWRVAVQEGSQWRNIVLPEFEGVYIPESDLERIANRTVEYDTLLISGSPEEQLATAEALADQARDHLRKYPASCSKRTAREAALKEIYRVGRENLGMTTEELDDKYRTLEDYVLSELVYEQSKTCCWNKTTSAMHAIIMSYAEQEQTAAEQNGECVSPTVFRAENAVAGSDGYDRWREHAAALGRAADWVTWTEDEACAQRAVADDTVAPSDVSAWCPVG